MRKTVCFDDVLLEPQFSDITTRTSVKLNQHIKNLSKPVHLPIVSAPMDTVTEATMATSIGQIGGLGILHRYNTIGEQVKMATEVSESGVLFGAAIGTTGDFIERATALVWESNVNILCIDVAHGHHSNVRYALEALKKTFGTTIHLMAGNVATLGAFNDLSDWGADSIRVGVGGGSICSTRLQTGHGIPTLQSVIDCSKSDRDTILIADGGIRNSGDIVKALAAGADLVMIGSLLAGTDQTPGEVLDTEKGKRKVYRGMASKEAQNNWRGSFSSIEGVSHTVPYRGCAKEVINELVVGIRSGLSYSGATSIQEFQSKANFVRQTTAGAFESSTHIEARY